MKLPTIIHFEITYTQVTRKWWKTYENVAVYGRHVNVDALLPGNLATYQLGPCKLSVKKAFDGDGTIFASIDIQGTVMFDDIVGADDWAQITVDNDGGRLTIKHWSVSMG